MNIVFINIIFEFKKNKINKSVSRAAALGPCSGGPSRLPKSLGLAERSALSRPPPRAAGTPRLSSGGPRAAQARAESRGSPTVDALITINILNPNKNQLDHIHNHVVS